MFLIYNKCTLAKKIVKEKFTWYDKPTTMIKIYRFKVIPRSQTNEILGKQIDGTIKVKLKAPPVDGAANEALIDLLSEEWDIPKNKIKIKSGHTGRLKIITIED